MQIGILGIGTELTSGQILNRNAQWISLRLQEMGVRTSHHLVVPDERNLMHAALNFAQKNCEILFLTGGLGPTTDDFTREVVAEHLGAKLKWDEASWNWICARLSERGIAPKEIQKQQCYFPEGAKILTNSQGTAHGFYVATQKIHYFVLPGPPREIEAIWGDHVKGILAELTRGVDPVVTQSWDCLGLPESEVATLTESAAKGSKLEIGYRVHLPYVEVKATHLKSQTAEMRSFIEKIDKALSEFCLGVGSRDVAEVFCKKIPPEKNLLLQDALTGGFLLHRLHPSLKSLLKTGGFSYSSAELPLELSHNLIKLTLAPDGEDAVCSFHSYGKSVQSIKFEDPYKNKLLLERSIQYFAEKALFWWADKLH